VPRSYTLVRPIFGFWEDIGQVLTIPVGAKITLGIERNEVSLCTASWKGRFLLAYREDIERNGISVEHPDELGQSTHAGGLNSLAANTLMNPS
jgi:hypothetical protein